MTKAIATTYMFETFHKDKCDYLEAVLLLLLCFICDLLITIQHLLLTIQHLLTTIQHLVLTIQHFLLTI